MKNPKEFFAKANPFNVHADEVILTRSRFNLYYS